MQGAPDQVTGYTVTHPDGTTSFAEEIPSPSMTRTTADYALGGRYNPNATDTAPEGSVANDEGNFVDSSGKVYSTAPTSVQKQNELDQYTAEAKNVHDTILNIQNGSIPLNAAEQAQVDGLAAQFQTLIDQQGLVNTGAEGLANVRGYQSGAAEYDPTFQVKTIGSVVTAGINKITDLQVKEASAIATLTQALKDKDILAVKDAWTTYNDATTKRQEALQKTIDSAAQAVKDAQKNYYDQVVKPKEDILAEVNKYGAPADVVAAVQAAPDLASAITAAGSYTQDPTSAGGQYASYVRLATAAGQTPMSPSAYLQSQAYKEAYNKAAGDAAGKLAGSGSGSGSGADMYSLPSDTQAKLKANGFTSFSSTAQDLAAQLVNGLMAPADLSKRATGNASYNDVLNAADKYSMAVNGVHFDIAKANRDYKFATNINTQNTLNYLGSLVGTDNGSGLAGGNLDQLISLSDARATGFDSSKWGHGFAPSSLPALNDVTQWAKIQTGDPAMAAYYATLLEVSDQVAKVLQGGGSGSGTSDAKLAQAQALFQKGFTPDQVSAIAKQLKELLGSRAASMVKDNPYLSDYATQFGVKTDNGVVTTNQKIINEENMASGKITAFYNTSPEHKALIDQIHSQFPDISASEVVKQLGI